MTVVSGYGKYHLCHIILCHYFIIIDPVIIKYLKNM